MNDAIDTYYVGKYNNGASLQFASTNLSWITNSGANSLFGINTVAPTEAIDVIGNGLFSGTLTASNLSGTNTGDQTITNSSDATSHTQTLSGSGGSTQFIEGSGITLTTGGTESAGTVTIAASGSLPYDDYAVILEGKNTSDPVATVLDPLNTGTVTWTWQSTGNYKASCTGCFPASKTLMFVTNSDDQGYAATAFKLFRVSDNEIRLIVWTTPIALYNFGNNTDLSISIRVYP